MFWHVYMKVVSIAGGKLLTKTGVQFSILSNGITENHANES